MNNKIQDFFLHISPKWHLQNIAFKRQYRDSHKIRNQFLRLSTIDTNTKDKVLIQLRSFASLYGIYCVREQWAETILLGLFMLIFVAYLVLFPFAYDQSKLGMLSNSSGVLKVLIWALFLLLQFLGATLFSRNMVGKIMNILPQRIKIFSSLIVMGIYVLVVYVLGLFPKTNLIELLIFAVSQQIGFLVILIVFLYLSALKKIIFNGVRSINHPDMVIFSSLVEGLSELENKTNMMKLSDRQNLLAKVETIANCIQKYLPQSLQPRDKLSDEWFRDEINQIVTALRAKKKALLMPDKNSQHELSNALSKLLVVILTGQWDQAEKIDVSVSAQPKHYFKKVIDGLLSLLVALAPFAFIWIARTYFSMNVPAPYNDYVTFASILWAFFTFIALVDPLFSMKMDLLKETIGAVSQIK